jgi:hypothetical protein
MQRKGSFHGISHPLYARILFFQQEDPEGQTRRALFLSADIIWWGTERMEHLLRKLYERWGLDESRVIFHATHTHSGPQTTIRFTPSLGKPDSDYIQMLESTLLEGIEMASRSIEPVFVERGTGVCQIGIHRRRLVGGKIRMAPNPGGPIDPEVNVIRFRTEGGNVKALLVHYACHPTTTADNYVSSEFPGVAMELVENAMGENAVAAFLQGCCGDIRPALIRKGRFYRGSDNEVCEFGTMLAAQVLSVLESSMVSLAPCRLAGKKTSIRIPFQKLPSKADLEAKKHHGTVIGEWSRLLLNEPERIQPDIPLELTLLEIADGLSLLAMNAEIVVEYGLFIKRQFAGSVLPVPYSNGMIGYVPTATQVRDGGYEVKDSFPYFGLPAPFDSSLETKIFESLLKFVRKDNEYEYNSTLR